MPKPTFVISDESLNRHGFRVLTGGISLEQFKKNPIMFFMHNRPFRSDREVLLPIGVWENIRKENGQLLADADFDMEDPFAKEIAGKVERGVIRMASPGLEPVELSSDPKYLLPGQKYETFTKSELVEASIVDIGSNNNALKLYKNGQLVELSADAENPYLIKLKEDQKTENQNLNNLNMKDVAIKLGLNPDSSKEVILAKLDEVLGDNKKIVQLQADNDKYKADMEKAENDRIIALVDSAADGKEKKITADKKAHFIELGKKTGYDNLKATFDAMSTIVKPTELLKKKDGEIPPEEDGELTFEKLMKKGADAVEAYKKDHPEEYARLYKENYEVEYNG